MILFLLIALAASGLVNLTMPFTVNTHNFLALLVYKVIPIAVSFAAGVAFILVLLGYMPPPPNGLRI